MSLSQNESNPESAGRKEEEEEEWEDWDQLGDIIEAIDTERRAGSSVGRRSACLTCRLEEELTASESAELADRFGGLSTSLRLEALATLQFDRGDPIDRFAANAILDAAIREAAQTTATVTVAPPIRCAHINENSALTPSQLQRQVKEQAVQFRPRIEEESEEEEETDEDPFKPFRPPYSETVRSGPVRASPSQEALNDPAIIVQGPESERARATVADLLNLLQLGGDSDSDIGEEVNLDDYFKHLTFEHQERNYLAGRLNAELPSTIIENWQREALSHITPLSFEEIRAGANHESPDSALRRNNFINFEEFCRLCPPGREEWKQRVENALGFSRMDPPRVGPSTAGYIPTRCLCGANPNDQSERAHICRCVPPTVRFLFRNQQVPEYREFEDNWVTLFGHRFQNPLDLSAWIVVSASNTSPAETQRRLREERRAREWASLERAEELTRGGDQSLEALAEYTSGRIRHQGTVTPTVPVAPTQQPQRQPQQQQRRRRRQVIDLTGEEDATAAAAAARRVTSTRTDIAAARFLQEEALEALTTNRAITEELEEARRKSKELDKKRLEQKSRSAKLTRELEEARRKGEELDKQKAKQKARLQEERKTLTRLQVEVVHSDNLNSRRFLPANFNNRSIIRYSGDFVNKPFCYLSSTRLNLLSGKTTN